MLISLQETPAIRLHAADDVAIALVPLGAGRRVSVAGLAVTLPVEVPFGHKFALRQIGPGQPVRRYGQIIGFATQPIGAGEHIHSHNLAVGAMQLDYAFCSDIQPVEFVPPAQRRSFLGFRRADGRVGTRNTVAIVGTVNCAAHTIRVIARRAREELLPRFPNVDDVVALTHKNGCATRSGSPELDLLQRTLAGAAHNPNVGAFLFVGLGCETNHFETMLQSGHLNNGGLPPYLGIQDEGGVAATVEAGLVAVERLLRRADQYQREQLPASELVVGLQCGGSDSFSGITGNPALGHAVDLLVAQGGTAVLSETPEIYGAEHTLTRRAATREVGERLVARVRWWEQYTARNNFEIDNNPSFGNKAGGLTTIYEKSLGAVTKGGATPLNAVYAYAERITERGFVYMDTPGYDPVSATGQVAGGCNLLAFTTGRGSCFGFKPVPSIKISTNSVTYARMRGDMDINAGRVIEGGSVEQVGREIFEAFLAVASGQPTLSESQGIGEEEFNPWIIGATM
ncbi:MAG: altronate dehydratase [Roseiflexaceae bacterium]|nr:altronate dehydratase [Roseiflexaceae bacterium]